VGVEHLRLVEQRLGDRERSPGVARQQDVLGVLVGWVQVDRDSRDDMGDSLPLMAKRRTPAPRVPVTVREAVERTVQATIGQAQETRARTQRSVDDLRRAADEGARSVRESALRAIEDRRPVTHEEMRDVQRQLRAIAKKLDEIEARLPAKRTTASKRTAASKRTTSSKRTSSSRAKKIR
jgi:hypothetical protein